MTPIVGHTYITFYRSAHPVAELIWDCDPTGSIESWSWQGDPAVIQTLAPIIENDTHMDSKWFFRIENAMEQTGLAFTKRYVGPPIRPKYGDGITTL